jgi:hypothetical protein
MRITADETIRRFQFSFDQTEWDGLRRAALVPPWHENPGPLWLTAEDVDAWLPMLTAEGLVDVAREMAVAYETHLSRTP